MKRVVLALLCVVMTAALASGVALQGKHYFYCAAMGVVIDDPCVSASPIDSDVALHEAPTDCCRLGRMPTMPPSALHAATDVPAASLVAVVAPPPVLAPPPAAETRIARRATGPPRAPAERVHALSMTFLT